MPKQHLEDASLLFGYTPGVIDVLDIAHRVLFLPQHVIQLAADRDTGIAMRMSGGTFRILPAEIEVLPVLPIAPERPFWCIFSLPETSEAVSAFVKSSAFPVLHVSDAKADEAVLLSQINARHILEHCHRVVTYLRKINATKQIKFLSSLPAQIPVVRKRRLALKRAYHFLTAANELVLESNDYSFSGNKRLMAAPNNGPYITAIRASARAIIRERHRVLKARQLSWPIPINLILTCPSFYQHVYRAKRPRNFDMPLLGRFIDSYRRQKNYSIDGSGFQVSDLRSQEAAIVIDQYRREIRAYSIAVATKAANHFVPVLRLPPAVNHVSSDLAILGSCARAGAQQPDRSLHKQERLFRRIGEQLLAAVPNEFLFDIDKPGNKIKLITNAPLEWLPIRGLPLLIRHEVSRIPTTPGNVMSTQTVTSKELGVNSSAFNEILVIRSFQPHERIRELLSVSIDATRPDLSSDIQIRIVDVSTADEFIEAVNRFEGLIMIFDGHGRASTKEVGAVVIGGEPIDLYQFRTRLRVPPIIILSSCDTHAIDGSHASVANTFLMLGATTVVGTLLPVSAADSALFTSRLILRISEFIPTETKKLGHALRWTTVVSGMQKMSYVTEQVLRLYKARHKQISFEQFHPIQTAANGWILNGERDWYEKTIRVIASELREDLEAIRHELSNRCQVVDTIKYIQLGNPDQILITD